ncbi:MAG: fdrA domain protein [Defluviitaleaceae bacterium]|nr:fdrA domain protein [Defluviitaleaceae bacterium]
MSKISELLNQDIAAINLGLERFYEDLKAQDKEVIQVDWKPPAANQDKIASLLAGLKNR